MTTFDIDAVTDSYLGTLVWTGWWYGHPGTDEELMPLDAHVTVDDLPEDVVTQARADVADFLHLIGERDLTERAAEHWDAGALGHDFALTRNRHGAGFWDRGHDDIGDELTTAAESMGESSLWGDPSGVYLD